MSEARISRSRYVCAFLVAAIAGLAPIGLIVFVLKSSDLVLIPPSLNPRFEFYRLGIEQLAKTSETLVTIDLAILGANIVWYLKNSQPRLFVHSVTYAIFVGCVISLYFGIKLGYMAGLTLASAEPDISPLFSLLRSQALVTLMAGLMLTALVIFTNLTSLGQPKQ